MPEVQLPKEIRTLLQTYYTCEVTTVNSKRQPITWPCLPYFHEETGEIIFTASIAFPVKAFNARRNPHVSLLYSDPTGSGLTKPPALLVQGEASVQELLDYQDPKIIGLFRITQKRQPDAARFSTNRFTRRLFSWYLFQRLVVTVTPRRVRIWSEGDFHAEPQQIEVLNVE
jgi:Pyridoxamine 5'-phosphate oxidase